MKKTIEEIYQKKTPLEHILLRPDTYIGSVEKETQMMYVWNSNLKRIVQKSITYVPGLYKIFDEIIVNAADNKIRDKKMNTIKINIDQENNVISVYNNGKGVPIAIHATEKVYVPELIFGQLLTSSNYDDNEKKVTGGRNGYGAKLCNIFSTEFIVETADKGSRKYYIQKYKNNMSVTGEPEITSYKGEDYTRITFKPDLKRFNMDRLDDDTVSLLQKRVYDLSGVVKDVRVYLNDNIIEVNGFKDYVKLYLNEGDDIIHQVINPRWEIAFTMSDEQFQQVSFVNSICTSKGGTHVNHVTEQIADQIIEKIKKKNKGINVKPFQVKSNFFIFINCLIDNPSFDSQTKENLTLRVQSFGSKCFPLEDFCKQIEKNTDIIERITENLKAKEALKLKKTDGSKTTRISGISKLEDANYAGGKRSSECTLILTEGDSAKTLAVSGLSVVGRDLYGVFPLRGKFINVREASNKQIMENKEISSIKKILGLQHNKVYEDTTSLRYGHIMIMADQDHDGSHIKGLIINFFDYFYPSLLKIKIEGFIQEFITPIIRATKGSMKRDFFTLPELDKFKETETGWSYKYYKGLGTSTSKDAKMYFSNLGLHVKSFTPLQPEDRENIDLAFNKKKADVRKTWLLGFVMGTYLDHSVNNISISDFVNKELILYSMADNIRSIPNVIDGFKPGQRKVIFGCFKRNLTSEIKVAQLVGYVAEKAAYHHGENSLALTIIGLAQDFVGSNNINLLLPLGQFGSRLQGGKDAAAPRYIFTALSPLSRLIFNQNDDELLTFLKDDNIIVEPEYYVPILPMVLVNGADGIGTGWSTNIPCYNPKDIINNIRKLIRDEPVIEMAPYYRNFVGSIEKLGDGRYQVNGVYNDLGEVLEITELPIGVWTQSYKEFLESLLKEGYIKDFKEYHTEKTVNFHVKIAKKIKNLKLNTTISTNNMVCFDPHLKIKKYATAEDILKEFFYIRLKYYMKRKEKLLEIIKKDLLKLENKIRFISEVVSDSLIINKRKKDEIIKDLVDRNYEKLDNYEYLLSMKILSLTYEMIEKLNNEFNAKKAEYEDLLKKTPKDLWLEDLEIFEKKYDEIMAEEAKEYESELNNRLIKGKKRRVTKISSESKIVFKESPTKKVIKKSMEAEKVTDSKKRKVTKTKITEYTTKVSNNKVTKEIIHQDTEKQRVSVIDLDSSSDDAPWKKYDTIDN